MTIGEKAVGIVLPDGLSDEQVDRVTNIKRLFAKLLNEIDGVEVNSHLGNIFKDMAFKTCIKACQQTVRFIVHKE